MDCKASGKFEDINEIWDKKFEKELNLFYSDDPAEDLKNK